MVHRLVKLAIGGQAGEAEQMAAFVARAANESSNTERRADEAEGRAEAMGLGAVKSLEEEIAELRQSDKVDEELAALKRRLGKPTGEN